MTSTMLQPRRSHSARIAAFCASSPARLSACSSVLTRTYAMTRTGIPLVGSRLRRTHRAEPGRRVDRVARVVHRLHLQRLLLGRQLRCPLKPRAAIALRVVTHTASLRFRRPRLPHTRSVLLPKAYTNRPISVWASDLTHRGFQDGARRDVHCT